MKMLLIASLLTTLFSFSVFAQEDRSSAPGEDPNEAITTDGAGVPNYGCSDPNKSCYKNLVSGRRDDNTIPGSKASGAKSAVPASDGTK